MAAGDSARAEAHRAQLDAAAFDALAERKRTQARNYLKAADSERGLAGVLAPLRDRGWSVLEDRRWPGSKRANIDFLLVGRAGVIIVDAKDWAEVRIENGSLFRGDSNEDGQIDKTLRLIDALHAGLNDTGLTPAAFEAALVFSGRDIDHRFGVTHVLGEGAIVPWLLSRPERLSESEARRVAEALELLCPPAIDPQAGEQAPSLEATGFRTPLDVVPPVPLPGVDRLLEALLAAEFASPIEDWMMFLHPDQNRLVRARWEGPARLSGPAGSGKTTVALHRAMYYALRTEQPVAFVTFVRTLPAVAAQLVQRVNAHAASRIVFTGLHALALETLRRAGLAVRVDAKKADAAFNRAWLTSGVKPRLSEIEPNPRYWRDEIDYVIKGRSLDQFADYATLARTGRSTALRPSDRQLVWRLYTEYEQTLASYEVADFNDVLRMARDAVARDPTLARFSSVIVDEVQDLPMVGVQFLDEISGDGPNRLMLVGDSRQTVYPGGFRLTDAGVNVVGRAVVLDHNYRNTAEILALAYIAAGEQSADLLDDDDPRGSVATSRSGPEPILVNTPDAVAALDALVAQAIEWHERDGVRYADMAALTLRKADAENVVRRLRAGGVPTTALEDYDGTPSEGIKVGTIKRAKGLEFATVLLPFLPLGGAIRYRNETEDAYLERAALVRREMFVAITRARDRVWVGTAGTVPTSTS